MNTKPLNCWEFMKCGRQPGGDAVADLGVCPTSEEKSIDGIHRGDNAGRACWVIGGTLCEGEVQGVYSKEIGNCEDCDFFKKVMEEEGTTLEEAQHLLEALRVVAR